MPSNSTGKWVTALVTRFPDQLGHLMPLNGWRRPLPAYALDNGRFSVWAKGAAWEERDFLTLCDRAATYQTTHGIAPRWVAVPDVVTDAAATFRLWEQWAPRLRATYGWPLAVVVQNGMTPKTVTRHTDAELVFVGGDDAFKWGTLGRWCGHFERVHVGRVNSYARLWECQTAGAESVDGTGLGRTTTQRRGLTEFLADRAAHGTDPRLDMWDCCPIASKQPAHRERAA